MKITKDITSTIEVVISRNDLEMMIRERIIEISHIYVPPWEAPKDISITFQVPSGGDRSGEALEVGELKVLWTVRTTEENDG